MDDDKTQVTEPSSQGDGEPSSTPGAQPGGEPSSGEPQEPTIESLRAEMETLRGQVTAAQEEARRVQAGKDKELDGYKSQLAQYQYWQQVGATQSEMQRQQRLRELRDSNNPDERDEFIRLTREAEEGASIRSSAYQQAVDEQWAAINQQFSMLTVEEKTEAVRAAATKVNRAPTIAEILVEYGATVERKAKAPMVDLETRLKGLQEEIEALKGNGAGAALRAAGGPERAVSGGGESGSKSYKNRVAAGEQMTSAEIDADSERFLASINR